MRALILASSILFPPGAYAQAPADLAPQPVRLLERPVIRELAGPPSMRRSLPQGRADSVGDGIAVGALVGAGAGLALMAVLYGQCDGSCDAPEPAPMYLGAAAFGAGAGALVGWFVDAARRSDNRVRISPVLTPQRKAVRVAVKF